MDSALHIPFNLNFHHWQSILLALIPALLNIGILLYIILFLPKNNISYTFGMFVLSLAVWQTSDALARMSATAETTLWWYRLLSAGALFIAPCGLHFTLLFTGKNKITESYTLLSLLYFPFIILTILVNSGLMPGAVPNEEDPFWGWLSVTQNTGAIVEGILIASTAMVIFILLLLHAVKIRNNRKKSFPALLIAIGFAIPTIQGSITQVIFPNFLGIPQIPIASTFMSAFSIATIFALSRYKQFLIPSSVAAKVVLKTISDILFITTPEGKLNFINDAGEKALGLKQNEIEKYSIGDLFPGDSSDFENFKSDVWKNIPSKKYIGGFSSSLQTKGGKKIPVLISAAAITVQNNFEGVLFLAHDITARKQREEEISQQRNLYETMLNAQSEMGEGIAIVEGPKFVYANDALCKIYGYTREELLALPSMMDIIAPEERNRLTELAKLRMLNNEGLSETGETSVIRKDGSMIHIAYSRKNFDSGGRSQIFSIIRDITHRKKADSELKHKSQELVRSNNELEQFAYVASHDLQEPLRTITSYLQVLEQRYKNKLDKEADEFINYAVEGAKRMHTLIKDLLSYSRVGTIALNIENTDCEKILEVALNNLNGSIQKNDAAVLFDNKMPVIAADQSQMILLFQNLIGNAIKYRRKNKPEIHIAAKRKNGGWLFSVSDNGIGIAKEYYEKTFVIFQRLHTRAEYEGTGIGLALCKKIVERHNGKIWVESEVGKGSTFYFTIEK